MSVSRYIGPIVPSWRVDNACIHTIQNWYRTYANEIKRQEELDWDLPDINSFANRSFVTSIPGDEFLPMVMVISGQTDSIDKRQSKTDTSKAHRMMLPIHVGVVASEPEEPRRLASYMGAAVRAALVQKGLEEGAPGEPWIEEVDWEGESTDDIVTDEEDVRAIAGCRIRLAISVDDVLSIKAGPPEPTDDPGQPPTVKEGGATIRITPRPIEE